MEIRNNKPIVLHQARRHAAYAEAGSFGEYLIRTYGFDAMKKFNRLSQSKERPWNDVFGLSLDMLEADWINYLNSKRVADAKNISVLKRLRKANPDTACNEARRFASY
jgi:hypothetical protein